MFGQTLCRSLGMGYVANSRGLADAEFVLGGRYEVEVAGDRFAADVQLQGYYDPTNARVKA
jgi:sarcosine dehydrogenase